MSTVPLPSFREPALQSGSLLPPRLPPRPPSRPPVPPRCPAGHPQASPFLASRRDPRTTACFPDLALRLASSCFCSYLAGSSFSSSLDTFLFSLKPLGVARGPRLSLGRLTHSPGDLPQLLGFQSHPRADSSQVCVLTDPLSAARSRPPLWWAGGLSTHRLQSPPRAPAHPLLAPRSSSPSQSVTTPSSGCPGPKP